MHERDTTGLLSKLIGQNLRQLATELPAQELAEKAYRRLADLSHGDLPTWERALQSLPPIVSRDFDLQTAVVRIGRGEELDTEQSLRLETALHALHPWRKGPFELYGIGIDSEWRSDLKWARLAPAIMSLRGRRVLDVGCGNGYYLWRMIGAGARLALGIDPELRFAAQFHALRHFMPQSHTLLLPLRSEDIPASSGGFDTVFSMGVLYHRRAPEEHLHELWTALRPGGELVLETLVIDGDAQQVLRPRGRYARMRNVWFIPSALATERWLANRGFVDVRLIDISRTTSAEQRRTAWMRFESLADCLDSHDLQRTVEGHPAPKRALILAQKPC